MTNEQMRREFEEWYCPEFPGGTLFNRNEHGIYSHEVVESCWMTWQAATLKATQVERERCALVCDGIANHQRQRYKTSTEPGVRYDPHIDGMSDGADLCADAIRMPPTGTAQPQGGEA